MINDSGWRRDEYRTSFQLFLALFVLADAALLYRPFFKIEEFGFFRGGHLRLSWSGASATLPAVNDSMRAFVVEVSELASATHILPGNVCGLIASGRKLAVPGFRTAFKTPASDGIDELVKDEGYAHTFFVNCAGGAVSFDLVLEQYNTRGGRSNYLSAGNERLVPLYSVFAAAYLFVLVFWAALVHRRWHTSAIRVHSLMGALLVVKILSLVFEAVQLAYQARTGSRGGWAVPYFMFLVAQGTGLLLVIALLGTGWSSLKPFLSARDKGVLLVFIPLQVVNNIALVFVEAAPPGTRDWATWRDILRIFDIACCIAVIVPILWSIRHLRDASRTDGKAIKSLVRLQLFREFYLITVSYLYFNVVLLFLLGLALPFYAAWVSGLCGELVTMTYYLFTGWKFRPMPEEPQLVVEFEEGLGGGSAGDAAAGDGDSGNDSSGGAVVTTANEPHTDEGRRRQQETSLLSHAQ